MKFGATSRGRKWASGVELPDRGPAAEGWRHPIRAGLVDGRSMEGEPKSPSWSGFQGARRLLVDGMGPGQGEHESSLPGLHEMVWGLGGRNALKSMGAGRAKSPCEGSIGDTVAGSATGSMPCRSHLPGGCNGGAQRAPLPRGCCTTTHILRRLPTVAMGRFVEMLVTLPLARLLFENPGMSKTRWSSKLSHLSGC